jgi:hypothetical protein
MQPSRRHRCPVHSSTRCLADSGGDDYTITISICERHPRSHRQPRSSSASGATCLSAAATRRGYQRQPAARQRLSSWTIVRFCRQNYLANRRGVQCFPETSVRAFNEVRWMLAVAHRSRSKVYQDTRYRSNSTWIARHSTTVVHSQRPSPLTLLITWVTHMLCRRFSYPLSSMTL